MEIVVTCNRCSIVSSHKCLTYTNQTFCTMSLPNLHWGTIKRKERKRQEVLCPDTHVKIATVNIHIKYCTVRSSQGWPNFLTFPRFWYRSYHTARICLILGGKCMFKPCSSKDGMFNLGSPLETKGFTPKAMFKFSTIISRIIRIARNTGVAVTRACSRAIAGENYMLHVEGLLTNRKAMTSLCAFLTIIPNVRDTKTLTWRECSTNSVFVIQIYQTAMVDYIWIIFLVPLFLIEYKS